MADRQKHRRRRKYNNLNHCTENHIFFLQTSWKDGLSKQIALEYGLSCIMGKDVISFSRKYDLICWTENEIWYFLQMFWKDGLFKKDRTGIWFFLYYLERWYFLPKTWCFFLGREVRDNLFQEIHENIIFSVCTYGCYKRGATTLCQKKSKILQKYT